MRHKLYFIWGVSLLFVYLINGCSKDLKNPIDPQREPIEKVETSLKKESSTSHSVEYSPDPAESDYSVEEINGLRFHCFVGIWDHTEPGSGLASMSFGAISKTTDWSDVIPYYVDEIGVEAWAIWRYLNRSYWSQIWHDSDSKEYDWYVQIHSPVYDKRAAWQAKARSKHWCTVESGKPPFEARLGEIEHTAYPLESK